MALNETTVTVVGTILGEVVLSRDGAEEVATFWLRSVERRLDKITQTYLDGRRLSVRVTCKRRLAIGVRSTLRQGDPVIVTGRLWTSGPAAGGDEALAVPEVEALAVGLNLAVCAAVVHRAGVREPVPDGGRALGRESVTARGKPLVEPSEPVLLG